MKPRIFVSSTYYDLKYIRNDLENFIKSFGYESVLFESGGVAFVPNNDIESSCYNEIKNCHMLILIIGGRYGSISTQNHSAYDEFASSITLKEYINAKEDHIPIYIFVDKKVESEYKTYLSNKELEIKYAYVDNVNVYKFLEKIYNNNDFIYTFDNFDDIRKQLVEQWAGLMFLHLRQLKEKKQLDSLSGEIENLKSISSRIDIAVNSILKKTVNEKEVKAVNKEQTSAMITLISKRFASLFPYFYPETEYTHIEKFVTKLLEFFNSENMTKAYTPKAASSHIKKIFLQIFNTNTDDFNPIEIMELYGYYNKEKDKIINNGINAFIKQVSDEILRTKVLPF